MRSTFAILAMTAAGMTLTTGDAAAQRYMGGRGYTGGFSNGYLNNFSGGYLNNTTGGYLNNGYPGYGYNNGFYGYGVDNYGSRNYGNNVYGNNQRFRGYDQSYYNNGTMQYGYSQPYMNNNTMQYAGGMNYTTNGCGGVVQAGYASAVNSDPSIARVNVIVPTEDTKLWIAGEMMDTKGQVREFKSPKLETGKNYTYTMKAQWTNSEGKKEEKTREIEVTPGSNNTVDFNRTDDTKSKKSE